MFFDTALSCCLLIIASGCSIYIKGSLSIKNFSKLGPEFIGACLGILGINVRSTLNLLSPFYNKDLYSIDPVEIENEDKETFELKMTPLLDKSCRIFSMSGFIYAMCEAQGNRCIGIYITMTIAFIEIFHGIYCIEGLKDSRDQAFHSTWLLTEAVLGWINENNYCLLACIPYAITFLALPPEKGYPWTAERIINNYMMMAYIFLIFEAVSENQYVANN